MALVQNISIGATAVCAIAAVFTLGRLSTSIRWLAVHAIVSVYVDVLAMLHTKLNNHVIFSLYLPFDFLFMTLAARDYLKQWFLPVITIASTVFALVLIYVLRKHGQEYIPFEGVVTSFMLQAAIWLLVLIRTLRMPSGRETSAIYLISGGLFLFVCTSIPVWAMYRYNISHYPGLSRSLQGLVNVAGILRYLSTTIALILLANQSVTQKQHAGR